jgi:two-component system phosphate regulon sensor histidine kinase PhoR
VEAAALGRAIQQLTERVEFEGKELAKKTRNLEALIAAVDEPLVATDNDQCVLLCNRSAEAILDAEPGELIGRPITRVFTHTELLAMHEAARAGEVRRGRVRLTTPLGKRVYQVSASPVPVAWGEGIFGAVMVLRDVTELDQAVQVKTDFVANASHELRTPVAAIRTAAETLGSALRDDPSMAERVAKMIVNHAGRLEELLRDLLDLSRLESPDATLTIEPVNGHELERQLAAMFEPACRERRLTLSFEFEDELLGMRTDRKLLTLILRNLIENATKFAFEGTEVRVAGTLIEAHLPSMREAGPPAPPADAAAVPPGGALMSRGIVRFEVIDKGIGIPLGHQDRVFERFYQVDPARTGGGGGVSGKRGTGLGLAIAKHAAKSLGGRVGLKSVWGQGTTAWAEVPVEFGPPEAADARQAS